MAQGMGISRVCAILNKVPSEETRRKMIEELEKKGVKTIGVIYFDPALSEAAFEGKVPSNSKAAEDTTMMVKLLLDESR
jgi:CO dehydrogenase nickel-insertion accessory protein CooC1